MSAIVDVYNAYMKLSLSEKTSFYTKLSNDFIIDTGSLSGTLIETRFSDGVKCLRCGSGHAVKNGKRPDGTQRYLCRDCKKSFLATTDSIASGTHKGYGIWMKYMECMEQMMTLKESAQSCGISVGTAFLWRHKILDALKPVAESMELCGIVEADETYFNISYKGNRHPSVTERKGNPEKNTDQKGKDAPAGRKMPDDSKGADVMPRDPHERGGDVHTKGLSSEKLCVMCAVDKDRNPVSMAVKPGKVSSDCVARAFGGRFLQDTVLCTDHEKAYLSFAGENGFTLIQMDTGCRTKGIYGIQRINAYHTKLKGFINTRLRGVSSKYLDNYLVWNDLMFCGRDHEKKEHRIMLLVAAFTGKYTRTCREIPRRASVPCPAG